MFTKLILILLVLATQAFGSDAQEAMVIEMRLVPCSPHRLLAALSGTSSGGADECSEYVLLTSKSVFEVHGARRTLLPVGDMVTIRLSNYNAVISPEDSSKQYKFTVVRMTLRSEWEKEVARSRQCELNCVEVENGLECAKRNPPTSFATAPER